MLRTINATPHELTIDGVTVPPSGILARARQENKVSGYRLITINENEAVHVPVITATYGEVIFDGDEEFLSHLDDNNTTIIVSLIAYNAMKKQGINTNNVFIPIGQIRDEQGKIVGCRGIGRPA